LKWQNYSSTFDFRTAHPREFVDDLLLSVVGLFGGNFIGHAKCIVTSNDRQYFASTTGLPPIVEWTPILSDTSVSGYRVEAVWIFLTGWGPVPEDEHVNEALEKVAARYRIRLQKFIRK
jgi:hypothetical protein